MEVWLGSRHAGAYLWRRVDLAGTLSGPFAGIASGYDAIQGRGEFAGALERTRNALAYLRARLDADRPRSRYGIQDPEVRRLQQSALAIDAASREPRQLSSRPGDHAAAATRCATDSDGPDAFLSRTRDGGGRVVPIFSLPGNNPNHCVDERSGAASACGEPHHRAGADNGRASCGTFVADRTGAAGVLAGHFIHFFLSETILPPPGIFKIPPHFFERH